MGRISYWRASRKVLIAAIVIPVFWSEFLALWIASWSWETLKTLPHSQDSIRVLLVSDPQLIGYQNEPWFIGPLARWDSDRYLRRGYAYAASAARPDFVVFLGDLIDEGVTASNEEYKDTFERFTTIFPFERHIQYLMISGDNDVGGEGEPVSESLITRFRKHFVDRFSRDVFPILKDIRIAELNSFNLAITNLTEGSSSGGTIFLSHAPVIRDYRNDMRKIRQTVNPDLILSAHDHTAELLIQKRADDSFERFSLTGRTKPLRISISKDDPLIELQSPTCSYRMGVPDMAYALLRIDRDPNLTGRLKIEYTLFWLPGRYPQLFIYLSVLVLGGVLMLRAVIFQVLFKFAHW